MIRRQKQEQESPRTYPALTSLLTKYKEALGQNILQSNPLATPFPDANASISPDRSPPTGPFLSASTSTLSSPRSPGMCYGATAARQNAGCPFHTVFDASATTSATSIIAASVSATPPSISPALRRGLHLAPPAPANALAGTMSSPRAAAGVANTPNATSPITDLLIQRFGRAQSASHVLQLLEEGRALASQCGCESLQLLLYTAALGAMARCLAAPPAGNPAVEGEGGDAGGGNGGIAPQGDELLELQWTVSEVLREMHGRRWLMSYKKIAAMLASLLVVLPALDWPVDDQRIISDIAARLAPAASAANKLAPVPLGKLCGAFRSLALLAEAASSRGRGFTPDVMREAGRYLQTEVLSGDGLPKLLEQADMAVLAMAVELVVLYDLTAPQPLVTSCMRRVDRLVAIALPSTTGVPDDDLGAKEPIDSPRGPYEYVSGAAASGRGVAPITTGSRSHHLGPSAGSPAGAAPEAHASDLDIASLLRVLVGWCSVKPGRPAPAQPWLRRHAGLVLRTQHAAAAGARLAELQEQLDRLDQKLESLLSEQEHFRAKAHTGVKSPDLSPASVSRMLLPAGCREPWGGAAAAVDTAAAGGSGRKRGGWTAADARLVLQGMGPGAAQAVTTILKAAAAANAEIAGLKQQLEALGVLGELVEQQQLQLQLVADGDLIDLLAALAVCVGNGAGQRLGSLAEAVIMARLEGLAPCQVLQTLVALAGLGHAPTQSFITAALRQLQPALSCVSTQNIFQPCSARYWPGPVRPHLPAGVIAGTSSISISISSNNKRVSAAASAEQVVSMLAQAAAGNGSLSTAPTETISHLLQICDQLHVPFPEEHLTALLEEVERRVLESLPVAKLRSLSTRAQAAAAGASRRAGAGTGIVADEAMTPAQLRNGVLLPLVRMRHGCDRADLFATALADWSLTRFQGLDEHTAVLLLRIYARNSAWEPSTQLQQAVQALTEKALSLRCDCPAKLSMVLLAASRALRVMTSKMQRPAGTPVLDVTDPRVAVLVLPAVEGLMQLNPSAQHIARAAQALFVELQWRGPSDTHRLTAASPLTADAKGLQKPTSPADDTALWSTPASWAANLEQPGGNSGRKWPCSLLRRELSPTASQTPDDPAGSLLSTQSQPQRLPPPQGQALALLVCMLEISSSSLPDCSLQGHGYLLAACNAMRYRPPNRWLMVMLSAAAAALENSIPHAEDEEDDGSGAGEVNVLTDLMAHLAGLSLCTYPSSAGEEGGDHEQVNEAAILIGNNCGAEAISAALTTLRWGTVSSLELLGECADVHVMLVTGLARRMLEHPWITVLTLQPDSLALAGRQLAALGLQPQPEWLAKYMVTLKSLLGSMSLTALEHVAVGFPRLLHATQPSPLPSPRILLQQADVATFLDTLLLEASRKLATMTVCRPHGSGFVSSGGGGGGGWDEPSGADVWSTVVDVYTRERRLLEAPTGLICELLQTSARWGVLFPEEHLEALEDTLERRRRGLLSSEAAAAGAAAALEQRASPRVEQRPIVATGAGAVSLTGRPCEAVVTDTSFICTPAQLREGVLLPLARLRQGFKTPDIYMRDLAEWFDEGFEGLDERIACDLLGLFANRPAWATAPGFRPAVLDLLVRTLSLRSSHPAKMSSMILAASRALRVLTDSGTPRPTGTSVLDVTDQRIPILVLPAVKHLLDLNPSAENIADAAQALFVELEWRGNPEMLTLILTIKTNTATGPDDCGRIDRPSPLSSPLLAPSSEASASALSDSADGQQRDLSGGGCGWPSSELSMTPRQRTQLQVSGLEEAKALLACMWEAAVPSLGGCRAARLATLLAACTVIGYRPPSAWLAKFFNAAAAALSTETGVEIATVHSFVRSMSQMDGWDMAAHVDDCGDATATGTSTATLNGSDSSSSRGGGGDDAATMVTDYDQLERRRRTVSEDPEYATAKGMLLDALGNALLKDTAVMTWTQEPEHLVLLTRQLAALGLQPQAPWLSKYSRIMQGLLKSMSLASLAHVTEGLALMCVTLPLPLLSPTSSADATAATAGDPVTFLDSLLLEASQKLEESKQPHDMLHLGLLVGSVHAMLWNARHRAATLGRNPDSDNRQQPHQQDLLSPASRLRLQIPLLSDAARSVWDRMRTQLKVHARKDCGLLARYQQPVQLALVVSALVHSMRSTPADWLHSCALTLLRRREAVKEGVNTSAGASNSALPFSLAPMLMDLLRLASYVMHGRSRDRGIVKIPITPVAATLTSPVISPPAHTHTDGGPEHAAAALVLDYVHKALLDTASRAASQAAADANTKLGNDPHCDIPSRDEWIDLLRAVMACHVRFEPSELTLLFVAVTRGAHWFVATAAAATPPPGRQLLRDAWAYLEIGLREVLIPVLPQTPTPPLLKQLREGLLESSITPVALEQASWQQLGLLCTYGLQVGNQLLPPSWWGQLQAEVARRRLLQRTMAADDGGRTQLLESYVGCVKDGVEVEEFLDPWDVASVCYSLEVCGCSVPEAALSMLRRSLGTSPMGEAGASTSASTSTTAAAAPGIGADVSWCHGSFGTDPDSVLRALHLLWVARQFGFLSNVPASVWEAAYGAGTSGRPALLALLHPQQLGQLVMLHADHMRENAAGIGRSNSGSGSGKGAGAGGSPAPSRQQSAMPMRPWDLPDCFTSPWMELLVESCCNPPRKQQQQDGFLKEGKQAELPPLQRPLEPAVAALAVCYCLPSGSISGNNSSGGRSSSALQQCAAALLDRALPALESALPLSDIPAFLEALERRALPLPQQHLHVLVTRLAAVKNADGPPVERPSSDGRIESGSQDSGDVTDLTQLAPVQAIRVVRSSLIAAAGHPCGAVTSVLPLLSTLMQILGNNGSHHEEERTPLHPSMTAPADLQSSPSSSVTPHHARQRLLRPHSSGPNDAPRAAAQVAPLAAVPPAELARLAAVLIESSHDTPLPPPAAVVVLRLITLGDEVVRLVPSPLLELALRHSLAFTEDASTSAAADGGGEDEDDFIKLPLPDAVHAALVQRLRPEVELCELLARLRCLGGSEEQTQRALLSCLPDDASVNGLSLRTVLGLLQQLADSGVRERRGITLRCRLDAVITRRTSGGSSVMRRSVSGGAEMVHRNINVSLLGDKGGRGGGGGSGGNDVAQPAELSHVRGSGRRRRRSSSNSNLDGPYAGLATRLAKRLAALGKTDCLSLGDATDALHLLTVLMRRVEGLLACEDFWRSIYGICSSVVCQATLGRQVMDKPAHLFQFLEAAHELGGAHCNEMVFRASHRADYLPLVGQVLLSDDTTRIAIWAAELSRDTWAASRAHQQAKVRLGLQPDRLSTYPISITGVQNLAEAIRPLVEAHLAAITEEEERDKAEARPASLGVRSGQVAAEDMRLALEDGAAVAAAGSRGDEGSGSSGGGGSDASAESQAVAESGRMADPRVLSARQLGLMFGLLFFQFHALPAAAQELAVMTHLALAPLVANLAGRAKDMTPLEHLNSMLDALEPIAQDTGDLHTNFDELFQISAMLASPLCRILSMSIEDIDDVTAGDEPLPAGLDPWDDAILLRSPFDISEDSLMEGLFLPHPSDAVTAVVTAMETGATTSRMSLAAAAATTAAAAVRKIPISSSTAATSKFRRISSARVRSAAGPIVSGGDGTAALVFEGTPPKVVAADIAGVRCVPNLKLPAALQTPPGRRHGMPGDAAGDAAREAYVRAAAPWLIAGRRVARLLRSNRQRNTLVAALEMRGLAHIGPGRWATAIGLLAHPQRTAEAMVTRGVITQEQAKALVGIMCNTAATLRCDSGDEPMPLVKEVSQELPGGMRSPKRGIGISASGGALAGVRIGIGSGDGSASTSADGERDVSSAAGLTARACRLARSLSLSTRQLEGAASGKVSKPLSGASSMGHPRRTETADRRQHHMQQSRSDAAALLQRAVAAGVLPPALSSRGGRRRLQAALTPLFTALEARPSSPGNVQGDEHVGDASSGSNNNNNNRSLVMVRALAALINEKIPPNVANAAVEQVEHLRKSVAEGTPVEVAKLLLLTDVAGLLEAAMVVKVPEEKRATGSAAGAPGPVRF